MAALPNGNGQTKLIIVGATVVLGSLTAGLGYDTWKRSTSNESRIAVLESRVEWLTKELERAGK